MVISDFDVRGWAIEPLKNNAPLLINTYAVKVFEIAWEFFESITRWNSKLGNFRCWMNLEKFESRSLLDVSRKLFSKFTIEDHLCFFAVKPLNHVPTLNQVTSTSRINTKIENFTLTFKSDVGKNLSINWRPWYFIQPCHTSCHFSAQPSKNGDITWKHAAQPKQRKTL